MWSVGDILLLGWVAPSLFVFYIIILAFRHCAEEHDRQKEMVDWEVSTWGMVIFISLVYPVGISFIIIAIAIDIGDSKVIKKLWNNLIKPR